jgi:ankyrin repeat protein
VAATSCDRQILRLLLENGADLDDGYIGYNTVFHNQIYENPEIMRLLVDFGVDINFRNKGNVS